MHAATMCHGAIVANNAADFEGIFVVCWSRCATLYVLCSHGLGRLQGSFQVYHRIYIYLKIQ